MRYLILSFILFITINCFSTQKDSEYWKTNNTNNSSMAAQSLSFKHSQKKGVSYYLMENDTLMQMIRINYLSRSEILYKIYVKYLQPIITQYFIDNKSEIWLLFLIAHSKR